jgi:large subunit ribosomal protein L28
VRAHRRFLPNLQRVRILIDGVQRRVNVCTACLKSRKTVRTA